MSGSDPFEAFGCPGATTCKKPRLTPNGLVRPQADHGDGLSMFPCEDCKAPPRIVTPDGAIHYRSYGDYCDD